MVGGTHPGEVARADFVGVLGYKNTGEPNGALGFLAGTGPIFNATTGSRWRERLDVRVGVKSGKAHKLSCCGKRAVSCSRVDGDARGLRRVDVIHRSRVTSIRPSAP